MTYKARATATRTVLILMLTALYACSVGQSDSKSEKKLAKQEKKREKAAKGAHVRATGTYVIDSHNGWAEIHPVSKLQQL